MSYKTLTGKDKKDFLNLRSTEPYKMKGHSFTPLKGVGKNFCRGCGLVRLRNSITDWCVDKGCNFSDHPQHKQALRRLTKMK